MRWKLFSLGLTAVSVAAVAIPGAASAGTLDQYQVSDGSFAPVNSGQSFAESFTAGVSGSLDQVDLFLGKAGGGPAQPLNVDILSASAGCPGVYVLAHASLPAAAAPSSPQYKSIPIAPPAAVVAGTQYAIAASGTDASPDSWGWYFNPAESYAGGRICFEAPPGFGWSGFGAGDMMFKTYVLPTPPPPPPPATKKKKCKKHKKKQAGSAKKCKKKKK